MEIPIISTFGFLKNIWYKFHKPNKHDIELYDKYKKLLIENGSIRFYKNHEFQSSFKNEYWTPLSNYIDFWNSIEYEFVDKKLNDAHKNVYSAAFLLGQTIAECTFFIGEGNYMRCVRHDEIQGETPNDIKENAKNINELAKKFIEYHELFVKLAHSKLYNS